MALPAVAMSTWLLPAVSAVEPNGLRAGAAIADITPALGVSLSGPISKRGPAQRIVTPLFARVLVLDNGPECTSKALDQWAYLRGVELCFIRPGKPIENCFVESFNGKFRDECLNQHWLVSLDEARRTIEAWRLDYNRVRPHSSLGNVPPEEFAKGATLRSATPTSAPPKDTETMPGLTL